MDLAQSLVRMVAQSFYETKHVLVVEALVQHSVLRDDDLAYVCGLGTQTKELHKVCAALKNDRLIVVHHRPELRAGSTRPVQKQYYYIPYREMIDSIKWRTYEILKSVQASFETDKVEKKEFLCPRCKEQYALLDIMHMSSDAGFTCPNCGAIVEQQNNKDGGAGGATLRKLNEQLSPITTLLKKIDETFIPDQTFETAWESHVVVVRDISQGYAPASSALELPKIAPTAVKGANNVAAPLAISLLDEATIKKTEAEKNAAAAKQNALPSWYTHSTIATNGTNGTTQNGSAGQKIVQGSSTPKVGTPSVKVEPAAEEMSAIDLYYAELAREQAKQDRQEAISQNGDLSDEFEDVDGVGASPASTIGRGVATPNVKLESPAGTGTGTPGSSFATTPAADGHEAAERANKRVKLENGNGNGTAAHASDSDEFEDV